MKTCHQLIHIQTTECLEFIDITGLITERVRRSLIRNGFVNIQTKHTTAAIVVNESEPLLLEDMKKALNRIAPPDIPYRHDDFQVRTVNMTPDETENGHSHCKALCLRTSETLNIVDGAIQLGRWQRVFLLELDSARPRAVSVMAIGE